MAAFKPTIHRDHIYKSRDGHLIKIIDIQRSGGLERPVIVTVDDSGRPISNAVEQMPTITKWNNAGYTDITETPQSSFHSGGQVQDSNSFECVIDDEGNLKILRNGVEIKRFNIRGPRGAAGADGTPGADGAPGAEGKRGSDGQPGRDGAPGVQGPQGIPGPTGDTWVPRITEDGKYLFFVNSAGQETEKYPIQGPKGDPGAEGVQGKQGPVGPVFIPQINADGELSWSNNGEGLNNPSPVNIKGEKGDKGDNGVIFTPVIRDGVLYWTNDKGLPNPTPVRITGPKGDVGSEGRTGMSAYEIWLSQGNRGTEQDFLDSLRGEKGSPFVDEHPEFSFKDLEDFECPIQRINTTLITSTGVASKSPEDIIEERVQEIAHLREEGERMKREKKTNWFKEFTWWCAGVDKPLLRMCPGEHSKYMGIGTVILFTALMAWFSSFIAMKLVFSHWGWAALFATFWAAMIFFLDRFITNTMYSDGKVTISKEEFFGGLPRILIAIFLGIVISAPLELEIFEDSIVPLMNEHNAKERNEAIDKARVAVNQNFAVLERTLRADISKDSALIAANQNTRSTIEQGRPKNTDYYREQGRYIKEGQTVGGGTTFDSRAYNRAIQDYEKKNKAKFEQLEEDDKAAATRIARAREELAELESNKSDSLRIALNNAAQKFDKDKDEGLLRRLSILHELAIGDKDMRFKWWFHDTDKQGHSLQDASSVWMKIADILLSPVNFLFWIIYYILVYLLTSPVGLIMLLFILIDISPVLYKMMLADGKYDNYLHQDKLLAQDKIRLSLAHMLKKLDEGELKRVAPFVVGDVYTKMAGDTFIFKTEAEYQDELQEYNSAIERRNKWIWPLKLFVHVPQKPTPPIISFEGEGNELDRELVQANKAVFDEVLDIKRGIILAAYRKWGKEMRFHRNNDPDDGSINPEFEDVRNAHNNEPGENIRTDVPETEA